MQKFPIIRASLFFIIGILIQSIFTISLSIIIIISLSIIIAFVTSYFLMKSNPYIVQKILIPIFIIIIGIIHYSYSDYSANYPYNSPKIKNKDFNLKIIDIDLLTTSKLSAIVELHSINDSTLIQVFGHKFILNIWDDTSHSISKIYSNLEIGNLIALNGTISRAKNIRNPGEFDYEKYLNRKGISGTLNCYKPASVKILETEVDFYANLVFKIRKSIDQKIKSIYNENSAALVRGILLADRREIDYELRNSFVISGVIHVLAVSGLHVGFIAGIFFLLLGRFNIRLKYFLTILGIILFLIITGAHSSVFRASIMAIILIIAKMSGRSTNGFNSISIAALVLLLLDSKELFNPGFQLSFSAVISILIIYPKFSLMINKLRVNKYIKNILLFASVSFAAQLGTLPFTLIYFNKLSLVSIFSNLIVIPLIGIVVGLAILSIILSLIFTPIAAVFASTNMLIIEFMYYFVQKTSSVQHAFLPIYNFSIYDGVLFYLFLALAGYMLIYFKNRMLIIVLSAVSFLTLISFMKLDNKELLADGELSIVVIDVGQGDAILIKFPNNKTALIDAGNSTEYFDNGKRVIAPLLKQLNINQLNYCFISHLDSDHFGGTIHLIEADLIDTVYKPYDPSSIKDRVFEEFMTANDVAFNYYSNQSFEIGGTKLLVLNDTFAEVFNRFDSNNKSGVIKIVYGENSFLFVGDAESEAEEYLVNLYGEFLESDVLKIGHHGSSTSSSNEFIKFVNPKYGLISAGIMNKFNHPSKKTLSKYEKRNVTIYRTDFEGAVIIKSNGKIISKIDWR